MDKISRIFLYIFLAGGSVAYVMALFAFTAPLTPVILPYDIAGGIACLFYVVTLGFMLLHKTDARSHKKSRLFTNLAMLGWIAYLICDGVLVLIFIALSDEFQWLLVPPLLIAGVTLALCIGSFRQLKKDV